MGRSTDFLLPLPVFRLFVDWYAAYILVPLPAFPRRREHPQSRHRNSKYQPLASVSRPASHAHNTIAGNRIDKVIAASFWINAKNHISKTFNKAVVYAIIPTNNFNSNRCAKTRYSLSNL